MISLNSIWSELDRALWAPVFDYPQMDSLAIISKHFDPNNERKWQIYQREPRRAYYEGK
jgi:hypothetical protein